MKTKAKTKRASKKVIKAIQKIPVKRVKAKVVVKDAAGWIKWQIRCNNWEEARETAKRLNALVHHQRYHVVGE